MHFDVDYELLIANIKKENPKFSEDLTKIMVKYTNVYSLSDRLKILNIICTLDKEILDIYNNGMKCLPLTNEEIKINLIRTINNWTPN